MAKDQQMDRDATIDEAIKAHEEWRRKFIVKRVGPKVWDYEYEQLNQTIKLVHTLLANLKGPDTRERE